MLTTRQITSIIMVAAITFISMPAIGQDMLAKQAPIDQKMRTLDSMTLSKLIQAEARESPSANLYGNWNNHYAGKAIVLPDSFYIDLREFCMPTTSRILTSNFGTRWGRQHKGIDIKVYIGDTIRAAFSGKVRIVKYEGRGYGKYVVIRHNNGLETIYGHMSDQLVTENQNVCAGDPIGLGGNTGRSTGSHLHFETRLCGVALNPTLMFDFKNQDVVSDYYMFRKSTYNRESANATCLRGVSGVGSAANDDVDLLEQNSVSFAVPTKTTKNAGRFHKVARGESLYSIARKRGTTVDAICKLNHITTKTVIKPGRILRYN